uniref:Zinc phosphodiesterase ELAC protein 2 n=1 Tax=Neogobius melanostomus TaxID=47308 RepID=A0A8C6UB12_9GOBI
MATNGAVSNSNNSNMEGRQKKKAKQKEPLRRTKTKETWLKRGDVHGPSTVYVQVLGAGSRDNSASLYVFSEYNRYLFNCGEGTQRLMQEHKLKAARLDNILLTRLSWENVGGLSGMILTLKETGVPECVLSGPPQLENFLSAIKSFCGPLEDIKLNEHRGVGSRSRSSGEGGRSLTESVQSVRALCSKNYVCPRPAAGPQRGTDAGENRSVVLELIFNPKTRDPSLVVSFICKLNPKKGNFLVSEAKELGLPVGTAAIGPLIKALKDGRSVEYEGREIRPEQVCTPTDPGPVFLVVECPSEKFIRSVCTNQQHVSGTEDPAALVVHLTPESVLSSERYQRWMESFPSSTEHLILNEHARTVHNIRSYKLQAQLHMVHPEVFPPLRHYRPQAALHVPNVRAECLLKFQLRPTLGWNRSVQCTCTTRFINSHHTQPAVTIDGFRAKKYPKHSSVSCFLLADEAEQFPEVVFLGTGSALPMKTRNVSGTLLNISASQSVLLDCGEGTFGQLCRHYGDEVDQAMSKINTIFISHMHADHHTGLLKLLYQRKRALSTLGKPDSPVFLLGPGYIMTWLNQYHQACEEILRHINFISNKCFFPNAEVTWPKTLSIIQSLLKKNGLDKVETCLVRHCKPAYACSLTHGSGWRLAFSGDTMPCDAFVSIGTGATLLIHEATLEDALEEEAVEKRHSTTSQAIGIGMKMNAEFIMLNHFSQRYAKIPMFSADFSDRVGISFDHMRVRFRDLKLLPSLTPALKALFAEDLSEMEEQRDKRELRNTKTAAPDFEPQKNKTHSKSPLK